MKYAIHIKLFLLLLLVLVYSCKDEPVPETYEPEDYLPVYPGSWWEYSNGETKHTASDYVLHSYENDIASPYETEEAFVPYWDGHYVYGYRITQNSLEFPTKELLRERNNQTWQVGRMEGNIINRKTIGKDISVDIVQYPYNDPDNCITFPHPDPFVVVVTDTNWELVLVEECTNLENCDTVFVEDPENGIVYPMFYEWQNVFTYDTVYNDSITVCDSIVTYDSVMVVKEYIDGLDPDTCWIATECYAKHIGLIKREVGSCGDSSATLTEFELVRYFIND